LDEFRKGVHAYEPKIAQLAEAGVDVINPSGAPPFMVLGYRGEQRLIEAWEKKYQTAIFTSGTTTLAARRALAVTRGGGATYGRGDINKIYARYFADAGFDVLDMAGMDVDFDKAQELSSREVYRFVKRVFLANTAAQAIYMLGPAWRTLAIAHTLEQDLAVPVIHAVPAQCWDIKRHLNVREPVFGFGRLIAEM